MCEGGSNDLAKGIDIYKKCCLHPAKLAWLPKELSLSPKSTGYSSSCSSYITMDGSRVGQTGPLYGAVLRFDEDNENEILTRYNREDHIPSPFESKVLRFDEDKENELLTRHNREDKKEDYVLDLQTTTPVIPIASWVESILLKRKEKELRNQNSQLYTVLVDMSQRNRKLQDELEKLKSLYSEP
ncbi:hypothetical protein TNIN_119981 [Trichonephila inaurata madagascariensis]|uniref:Uncharacterized protein n=1 Tax=Trichonephila inaurata madagascariensis TaxID=2747483 RepID=A0A8X6WZD5_9ARAC|nr:hypothetical protein TNIN_119981 [Trichonephila inaurata madagascariensis]